MKLNKLIALLAVFAMLFAFVGCPSGNEPDTPDTPVTPETVADVTFEPAAGEVEEGAKIALATATEGADIYYEIVTGDAATTLTKENATTLTKYTEAFDAVAGTVYAIAVKGDKTSEITSAAYTIAGPYVQAVPYAETTPGKVEYKYRLRFYADVKEGDKAAKVYWQFVEPGAESTLTKENYADPTIATPYSGSIGCEEHTSGGSYYCIAVSDGGVSDIVSFSYTWELPSGRSGGLAVVNEKIAAATHADVTATADIKDGLVEGVTEYKVTDKAGLDKLAEIVNAGNKLAGYTFTQAAEIAYNTKVLTDDFKAPAEAEKGKPNADLSVFAGLKDFAGTYDGNNYVISGLYIYPEYKKAGFVGTAESTTVLKNVILKDACSVISCVDDDHDDRVGGLVGYVNGDGAQITNCIFVGAVGSEASLNNGGKAEYYGGLVGDNNKKATVATDCIIVARVTAVQAGNVLVGQKADNMTQTNVLGFDASLD